MAALPKKKPFLPPAFVRAMLAGHSALGLAFAALIYVVCLTGTVAVFLHELERWENPQGPVLGPVAVEAVDTALRQAYDKAVAVDAAHDIYISVPGSLSPWFDVRFDDHDKGIEGRYLADKEGQLVRSPESPWSEFLLTLHIYLHLPPTWGIFLVGLTGVALLSSLISGLLSHPRIFKDAFALRWGGSRRLQEADLHNRLGVWGLPFHIAVSLTGALLGLSTLIVGILALANYDGDSDKAFAALLGAQPGTSEVAAPLPSIVPMTAEIERRAPGAVLDAVFVQHVATEGQLIGIQAASPGHLAAGERYFFDAEGRFVADAGQENGTIGQQILGALQPLHFGWFGGIWMKLAYGILGLALTVVTTSGVAIWLARRRDKGRPAPGWERVWAAMVWSQPLGLGTTALAALFVDGGHLLAIYLAALAVAGILAALTPDGVAVSRRLRALGGATLVLVGLAHAAIWASRMTDPAGWALDAAFVLAGLSLMGPLLRTRPDLAVAESLPAPAE